MQANAAVDSVVVSDTLIFKVDWIVKLLSLRTIDGNLTYGSSFGIGGEVGFELSLRNIAMTTKKATLTLVLKDELNTSVNSSEVVDFEVQPNESAEFIYLKLSIPKSASIGNATAEANALTAPANQNGVPYCPHVTVNFSIAIAEPLAIMLHDASLIGIFSSTRSTQVGDTVTLDVETRNDGTEPESFNVTAYFGDVMVDTLQIIGLAPYSSILLNYTVDTSAFGIGTYTTTVSISSLPNEADLSDNTISGDTVDIVPQAPVYVHDIGITNMTLSGFTVHVGDSLQVNVTVTNKGNASESFNVSAYYDLVLIDTIEVADLQPMNSQTSSFVWDTSSLNRTVYQISAVAHLDGDANPSDNTLVDGSVNLVEPLSSSFVLDWFDGFLIFGVILFAVLLVALLFLMRSRKKDEESRSH